MRSLVVFVIGAILGATAILLYLQNTQQLAIAAEHGGGAALSPALGSTTALLIPVVGVGADALRSDFNQPRGRGRTHGAIDIRAPRGTPVVAAIDGSIRKLFTSRAGGITIYQTDPNEEKIYYYAHLDRYAAGLKEGMKVTRGTVIGYVGTSGNAPVNTPHLHFAIMRLPPTKEWWKGDPIDPYPFLVGLD
jgi:murein DD-endopeptidase MepM/ murein hydrolase activator NlpD